MHAGLRAAIQGVSFMPMAGLAGSDLVRASGFRTVADPYTGQEWVAIPAIAPDWCIVHVHEADEQGNSRILGPKYDDVLKARAARNLIVTAERIVDGREFAARPELTDIPGFLVTAVVHAPGGAWPHGCHGCYPPDEAFFEAYLAACAGEEAWERFVRERALEGVRAS